MEYTRSIFLARQLDVKVPGVELEEAWQQARIIHICAMGRVLVAAGTGVHSDLESLGSSELAENPVIETDEPFQ